MKVFNILRKAACLYNIRLWCNFNPTFVEFPTFRPNFPISGLICTIIERHPSPPSPTLCYIHPIYILAVYANPNLLQLSKLRRLFPISLDGINSRISGSNFTAGIMKIVGKCNVALGIGWFPLLGPCNARGQRHWFSNSLVSFRDNARLYSLRANRKLEVNLPCYSSSAIFPPFPSFPLLSFPFPLSLSLSPRKLVVSSFSVSSFRPSFSDLEYIGLVASSSGFSRQTVLVCFVVESRVRSL